MRCAWILLLCWGFSVLYAYNIDSLDNKLSEEEWRYLDSVFATSMYQARLDSTSVINTLEKSNVDFTDFSYQTEFYITQNANVIDGIGRILLVCDSVTFTTLSSEIIRYAKDIHNAYGSAVLIYSLTGATKEDVKQIILDNYSPGAPFLSGVVLIGDIPYAEFCCPRYVLRTGNDSIVWDRDQFPCDYYYMDLDGVWLDMNADGAFDSHTGRIKPEIFVGRIYANIQTGKYDRMQKYFDKNHRFWTGEQRVNKKRGLSFTGDDWTWLSTFRTGIHNLYGSQYTDNMQDNQFTKENYINAIENDCYEFIQFACHSNVTAHIFDTTTTPHVRITNAEIRKRPIKTLGYNLFCCKACRWNEIGKMSLAEAYLYSDTLSSVLSIVGSTKTGGMAEGMPTFYKYLGEGDCIGTAYRIWWQEIATDGIDMQNDYRWFYGMCILGDPMINFLYDNQCNEVIDIPSWNQNNTADTHIYYAQEEITASCTIPANKTLELHANQICLTNGFHTEVNSRLYISVDPCYDNNVSVQRIVRKNDSPIEETVIEDVTNNSVIQIYPNPCTTTLSIKGYNENKVCYKIFDMNGLLVNSGLNSGQNIDVSMLPAGLYTLFVEDENKDIVVTGCKIIKQ